MILGNLVAKKVNKKKTHVVVALYIFHTKYRLDGLSILLNYFSLTIPTHIDRSFP